MDPFVIGLLKQVAGQGIVASLLLAVLIVLWRTWKRTQSCKDPSSVNSELPPRKDPPCNQCLACKDRLREEERARFEEKVDELHNEVRDLLREMAQAIQGHRPPEDT